MICFILFKISIKVGMQVSYDPRSYIREVEKENDP